MSVKYCSDCKEMLELSKFSAKGHYCRDCARSRLRRWKAANRERYNATMRALRVKTQYGITRDEYEAMIAKNTCDICWAPPRRHLNVDHDHLTGKVRGVLCENCNRAIGLLKDDIAVLWNAVRYLERHK